MPWFNSFVFTCGVNKPLPDDFSEFLTLLNKHGVDYLVVGGWAVGVYGYPRATGDIPRDFFFRAGNVFRMGVAPMKIEILTSVSGVDFHQCHQRRNRLRFDEMEISFIGFDDLVANKRASGRAKDVADLENLGSGEEQQGE